MTKRVAAVYFDSEGRALLVRSAEEGKWELPSVEEDPGDEPWEIAPRVLERLGYEAMALRSVGESESVEYWLMAARSGGYSQPGDFFAPDELPALAKPDEAGIILQAKSER